MADAIPNSPDAKPEAARSTVLVEPPMTTWQALQKAGWWTVYDWIMLGLIVSLWLVALAWLAFSPPSSDRVLTLVKLAVLFLFSLSLKIIWLISLVFRCSWFVLQLHADVATLPYSAARIAVAYLSGKKV